MKRAQKKLSNSTLGRSSDRIGETGGPAASGTIRKQGYEQMEGKNGVSTLGGDLPVLYPVGASELQPLFELVDNRVPKFSHLLHRLAMTKRDPERVSFCHDLPHGESNPKGGRGKAPAFPRGGNSPACGGAFRNRGFLRSEATFASPWGHK